MKIGKIALANPIILAPMAGITDKAFRLLAQEQSCGLVYTEMVSAKALVYRNKKTYELIDLREEKGPISVQLFGAEPGVMAEAAQIVESHGASIIDINMGCPVPKVVKQNEGSKLMLNPDLAARIVTEIKKRVHIPVTVKFRKGWDEGSINAVEFAQRMEASGADALAIHGRTRSQFYAGKADWDIIRQVKDKVKIPVIGNGDVFTPENAFNLFEETNCDGVMIGRGTLGNPWLIGRSIHYLQTGEILPEPSIAEKVKMTFHHSQLAVQYKGETVAMKEMRKHIGWYFKGLPHATEIRRQITQVTTLKELKELLMFWG